MIRWMCKEWILNVDLEGTKEYYRNFQFNLEEGQEQIYENYRKYCAHLPEREQKFFDSLGITPRCCNVSSFGMDSEGKLSVWGTYYIKGTYEHIMKEIAIPVEEFVQKKLYLPGNQSRLHNGIHVGSYGITFLYPGSEFNPCPENLPKGWIAFEFWNNEMPWLLEEPCKMRDYEPVKWWQLRKRCRERSEFRKAQKQWRQEWMESVEYYMKQRKIHFVRVEERKVPLLQKSWFLHFVPEDSKQEAQKVCFSSGKWNNFLWHLFSYEFVPALENAKAEEAFRIYASGKAWIFTQEDEIAWKIDHAERLEPVWLNSIQNIYADFYVAAADFSWTYVHTHEEDLGPYFYKSGK